MQTREELLGLSQYHLSVDLCLESADCYLDEASRSHMQHLTVASFRAATLLNIGGVEPNPGPSPEEVSLEKGMSRQQFRARPA
jgi:hypothetical protein